MKIPVKISSPDGKSITTKEWTCVCNSEEELLQDCIDNHTFLIDYIFEIDYSLTW
jgi:hypothetical protein